MTTMRSAVFNRSKLAAILFSTALCGAAVFAPAPGFVSGAEAAAVYVKGVNQSGFADVVSQVKPAVVSVRVKGKVRSRNEGFTQFFGGPGIDQLPDNHPLKRFFRDFENRNFGQNRQGGRERMRPVSQGSGFFISENGYLVTNNHVVSNGSAYVVVLDDGTELDARLVGTDSRTDLAVLKVDNKRKFTYVDFADDTQVRVGDWVVAVGNPFGLGGTVTAGIVSARGRDIGASVYDDFIQIDAAVNRGNSGGPTFNLNGQVVGVNTAIFSPSGGNVGIAFAIPASTVSQVARQLMDKGSVERGWLGVQIQPVTKEIAGSLGLKESKGALIADPMDGPAAKAGIKAGDVIIAMNGETVADARDLARRIGTIKPDETVTLGVWRNGRQENIKVKLTAMPATINGAADEKSPSAQGNTDVLDDYGITVTPSENGKGVVVTNIDPDSDAAENGLRPGDVILGVNGRAVAKAADISMAMDEALKQGRPAVALLVESNGRTHFVPVPLRRK